MNFSLFEVILLIGIAQGFFISALIWVKKSTEKSKLFLSAILVVFNLLVCKIFLYSSGLWETPFFRFFPSSFELLIQPFIWFYINALIFKNFNFLKKHYLHFLPFIIFFTYCVVVYMATKKTAILPEKDFIANNLYFAKVKGLEDILSVISSLTYLFFGAKLVIGYQKWLKNNTSNTDFQTYRWLKVLMPVFFVLIFILILMIGSNYFFYATNVENIINQIFFIYLAFVIYFLGFKGYNLQTLQIDLPVQIEDEIAIPRQTEEFENIKAKILYEFEQKKAYLDPDLNIQKLAEIIKINQNLVSQVINQSFNKSFRTLVNDYRIAEVKSKLQQPNARKFTLVGIALDAGFNSEASFYRIFKTAEGVSPKVYLDRLVS